MIGILDTSIGSRNVGDQIIMDACSKELASLMPNSQFIRFSSHDSMSVNAFQLQAQVTRNFLCGTNCLSSRMFRVRTPWSVGWITSLFLQPVVTMGVGWGAYQPRPDAYTRALFGRLLDGDAPLSVRDNYTKTKLEECGFRNVLNTACATMWGLTPEHCRDVPTTKANRAVFTFTNYARNAELDIGLLEMIESRYDDVTIWLQSTGDLVYLRELQQQRPGFFARLAPRLLPPNLAAYDAFLDSGPVDYVGTRLHGGIRALQRKHRTLILAVDNRGIEKGRDFDLPVVERVRAKDELLERIDGTWDTRIRIPHEEIEQFRSWVREHEPADVGSLRQDMMAVAAS